MRIIGDDKTMLDSMVEQVERFTEARVLEAPQDTRVVVIQGARQVGNTTCDL